MAIINKLKPFIGGCAIANLIVLNHVYQNELLKQQIRNEIRTLEKIRDYVSIYFSKLIIFIRNHHKFWISGIGIKK